MVHRVLIAFLLISLSYSANISVQSTLEHLEHKAIDFLQGKPLENSYIKEQFVSGSEVELPVFLQQDEEDDGSCLEEVHATITCDEGGDCSIIDDSEEFDFDVVSNEDGVLNVNVIDNDIDPDECTEEVTVSIACDGEDCVITDNSTTYELDVEEEEIDDEDGTIDVDEDIEPVEAECIEDVVVTINCVDGECDVTDDSDYFDISLSDTSGDEIVLVVNEVGLEDGECTDTAELLVECDNGECAVDDDTDLADATAVVSDLVVVDENGDVVEVDEDEAEEDLDDEEEAEEDLDDEEHEAEDLDDDEELTEDDNDLAEAAEDTDDAAEAAEDLDDADEAVEDTDDTNHIFEDMDDTSENIEDVDDNLPVSSTDTLEATEDVDDPDNIVEDVDDSEESTEDLDDADHAGEDSNDADELNEDDNDDEEAVEDLDDVNETIEDSDDADEAVEDEDDDEEAVEDEDDGEVVCVPTTEEVHVTVECIDGIDCDITDDSENYDFVVTNVGDDVIDITVVPDDLDSNDCTETVTVTMSCDEEGCNVTSDNETYDLGVLDNTVVTEEVAAPSFLSLHTN
ncbi:hypothetical protein SteCoe_17253 [Stentor coeruleus]|uniref:Uncharacterized protein n=1 Tax=Stentor coeruleus TaxID=5963 RepID=A0A1R2BZC9_9CILI|nr:hypothetical protein SteCoe_17253 [Stentor coeruleus]